MERSPASTHIKWERWGRQLHQAWQDRGQLWREQRITSRSPAKPGAAGAVVPQCWARCARPQAWKAVGQMARLRCCWRPRGAWRAEAGAAAAPPGPAGRRRVRWPLPVRAWLTLQALQQIDRARYFSRHCRRTTWCGVSQLGGQASVFYHVALEQSAGLTRTLLRSAASHSGARAPGRLQHGADHSGDRARLAVRQVLRC